MLKQKWEMRQKKTAGWGAIRSLVTFQEPFNFYESLTYIAFSVEINFIFDFMKCSLLPFIDAKQIYLIVLLQNTQQIGQQ